jgi:hypothetical protein
VTPSGHLRGAAKLAVRSIVVSAWMSLLSSPIQNPHAGIVEGLHAGIDLAVVELLEDLL